MRYVFADCVLDTELATLHRAGRAITLRPKVFHLLHYLLKQRAHLVTKDALCAQVWPGQFISDAALEGCLKLARQAIGDSGRAQRLIQTRRGYGYRFIGVVEEQPAVHPGGTSVEPGNSLTPPAVAPPAPASVRSEPVVPCGEPEAPLVSVGVGERKLVTLLSCTLVHDAAPGNHRGLDTLHSQMRTLYALARSEVQQYGGTLQPVTGERFMAMFGIPVAQEDHARRAVLAALGLLQRVALGATPGAALAVRMGLHTGLVAVGGIGGETEVAMAVVGDTATLAAVLQEHALPGTILCSDTTARLVQTVADVEAVGPLPGGGQATPVMAYKVLEKHLQRASVASHEARPWGRFVGRSRELATLLALLARVENGQGHVVGIMGDPGIGKSRLLDEFRQRLTGRRLTYLRGRCLSYGSATPYLPVLDLLRHHCGTTEVDSPEMMTAKVRQGLREVGMAPEEWAPYLLHLLGLDPGAEQIARLSPQTVKARTFEALVQLIVHRSRQHLLVLEVEDLHWLDATSEEWLAALVERMAGLPLLILGSYRPGYRTLWVDKSYATQMTLRQLTPSDSRQVVQAVLRTEQVSEALVQAILAKADGNPFFLEELAQTVVEQGEQALVLGVPDTVQAVLAARIDLLPSVEKHLLQIAAVIGTEVPVSLLQAITALPEEVSHHGLTHLQATEFLYETCLVSERLYTFKHALTHQVAYESLVQDQRRALHARIVETIEACAGDRLIDQVEHLAYHALRGELWATALTYLRQAGSKALTQSANPEAATYLEQALQALQHLPNSREAHLQAIDVRLDLREALDPLGAFGRLFDHLQEAATLAEALGDRGRLGRVWAYMTSYFWQVGDYDRALDAGHRALALAINLEDVGLQVTAQLFLGQTYSFVGEHHRALDCLGQNMAALEGTLLRERFGFPSPPSVQSCIWLVRSLAELGAFSEGIARIEVAVQIAAESDPLNLIAVYFSVALLYLRRGNLHHAIPVLEHCLPLCHAWTPWLPTVAAALGYAYVLAGRVAEAIPLLEQAREQETSLPIIFYHKVCVAWLSEALLLVGRMDEASILLRESFDPDCDEKERGHWAWVLRLLGEIQARRHPAHIEPATEYYRQALARADELGMRPLQAHCHRGLGMLYAKTGQAEQACTALATAIMLYRAMDMTFWLPQAEAELAQVEVRHDV